jgi:hypothetical protein
VLIQRLTLCRILLQSESSDGSIVPGWVDVTDEDVYTIREVFDRECARCKGKGIGFSFHRLPLTAEEAPEPAQFDAIMSIVVSGDVDRTSFILQVLDDDSFNHFM